MRSVQKSSYRTHEVSPTDTLAVAAHDLKDPLATILMGAAFLRRTLPREECTPSVERVLASITRSADRIARTLDDLFDLRRLEEGRVTLHIAPYDLRAIIASACASVEADARVKGVTLETQPLLECAPLSFDCDRDRVQRIVSKLLANAVKFTPPQGVVSARFTTHASFVDILVRDTGRGIPENRLRSIFDHDANAGQMPRDGLGLGLPIAWALAKLHGGEIRVRSKVGEGSEFTLRLPYRAS